MSVKKLILDYALACNPITINGIYWELDEQYVGEKPQDYEIAEALTELIVEGKLRIGDDCQSFDLV